jgi:hypothetical protein
MVSNPSRISRTTPTVRTRQESGAPPSMATGSARPADRYGAPAPWVRPAIVTGVVVVAAAGLGWLLWAAFYHSNPQVASRLVSYQVVGTHHVEVIVEVDRVADVTATCRVLAEASDHAIVGDLTFRAGPTAGGPSEGRITSTEHLTIVTERLAATAVLRGCTTSDQQQPR